MKPGLCLFFLTMGWTAWTVGSAHAAAADDAKPQQHATEADRRPEYRGTPRKKPQHVPVAPGKTNHPRPSNDRAASVAGRTAAAAPSDSRRPVAVPSGAPAKTQTVAAGRSVQRKAASRASATLPSEVRHRSPNAATVGGPKSVTAANNGAINGTHMARKP